MVVAAFVKSPSPIIGTLIKIEKLLCKYKNICRMSKILEFQFEKFCLLFVGEFEFLSFRFAWEEILCFSL